MKNKIYFVTGGALAVFAIWILLGAAAPAPIQRNQFSTNIVGVLVKGPVGFDSTVNITSETDIGGTLIVTNVVQANNIVITNNGSLAFATNTTGPDTFLVRDNAPNVLAMRTNGATPQVFRVYSSFTDSANNEYLEIRGHAVTPAIVTSKNGTGLQRQLYLSGTTASAALTLGGSAGALNIDNSGNILAGIDDLYNLGATNANRWRILYLSRGLVLGPNSGGGLLTNILTARAVLDFPSTAASTSSDLSITVTGASTNDVATVQAPPVVQLANGAFTCFASNNTVYVRFMNYQTVGALDPGAASFSVLVNKF